MTENKIAYLIQGLPGCGRTTFGLKKASEENGVCLSYDDFFYKIHEPDKPDVYSFVQKRTRSAMRWFWMELKKLADASVSPIYIDQNNFYQSHTWRTAAFLMERYDYDIELVHPDSSQWREIRELLKDKDTNVKALEQWAYKLETMNDQNIKAKQIIQMMELCKEYTVEDLIEQF